MMIHFRDAGPALQYACAMGARHSIILMSGLKLFTGAGEEK